MIYSIDPLEKEVFTEVLEVANIHAQRLKEAMDKLAPLFPVTGIILDGLSVEQVAFFELFTGRFSKLQDLMGANLYPRLLAYVGETQDTVTFMDKLNRLEKIGLIDNAEAWKKIRDKRNHLSHEYPNDPSKAAEPLNQVHEFAFILLNYFDRLKAFAKQQLDISLPQ